MAAFVLILLVYLMLDFVANKTRHRVYYQLMGLFLVYAVFTLIHQLSTGTEWYTVGTLPFALFMTIGIAGKVIAYRTKTKPPKYL